VGLSTDGPSLATTQEMLVHRSNSLSELVDHLSRVVRDPALNLFEPETIVIQSAGMERYLSRELSRRSGIVANVVFPYPRVFFRDVLDATLGKSDVSAAFERESLAWVLYAMLRDHAHGSEPAFKAIRSYLEEDEDGSKRLLLAEKLANLFDQYVTYRPRMVLGWQNGQDDGNFQAILFRDLCDALGGAHFAARCHQFLNELSDDDLRRALPVRVSLMGGPGLPPLYLQMFARIGKAVDCHVFSFSVCQEFFADAPLLSRVEHSRGRFEELEAADGYFPLLGSFGTVGADYQHLLETIGNYEEGGARFQSPLLDGGKSVTVLKLLQQALIEGQKEPKAISRLRSEVIAQLDSDLSITLDSCHSPLREIEALHDRLLGWFAEDPTLRPEDVVVLAPQVEKYSPLISAVFAARAGDTPQIPFRIADRSEKLTNAAARAFLLSFSVLRGRFKASEVLDLLQLGPVRARYAIQSSDLERITRWLSDSNIRWGVDGEHRQEWGLPRSELHTFRFGLRRLLLGFALPDDGEQLWNDVVPLDNVTVADLPLVGKLCEFCENLFALRRRVAEAGEAGLSIHGWRMLLADWMDAVLGESQGDGEGIDENWDTGAVRLLVHKLLERADAGLCQVGAHSPAVTRRSEQHLIGFRALLHLLEVEFDSTRPSTDFLAGGVTFCALLPLRTIPFRAVCVLGLNQGEFPRVDSHFELDLIAQHPKRGDRSLRADDRYLFLEVLLAAREKLALSYVGRSVQDNTERPPSIVVTELSTAIESLIQTPTGTAPYLEPVQHPLQPFHSDYFRERPTSIGRRELRSFDLKAYSGAQALCAEPQPIRPFFSARKSVEKEGEVELTLDQLVRFWKDPSQAFFEAHGVRFSDDHQEVEDREPVVETGLGRYLVGDRLLSRKFQGKPLRPDIEVARGDLPVGAGGSVLLKNVTEAAEEIFSVSARLRRGERRAPESIQLSWQALSADPTWGFSELAGNQELSLAGAISDLYGNARLETSYGQLNTNRKLGLWVRHLAACASGIDLAHSALVVRGSARDRQGAEVFVLKTVEQSRAREILGILCLLAALGRSQPVPFFPLASEAYFHAISSSKNKLEGDALVRHAFDEARKVLLPSGMGRRPDLVVTELYRGRDPLGMLSSDPHDQVNGEHLRTLPFARLAEVVFGPLHQAIIEDSLAGAEAGA
jgi:exodeoxyribonuclease V gamma subunit